jgi:tRNA A37 N6-isopentenylltransferase MiaA
MKKKIIIISGATASGKSEIANKKNLEINGDALITIQGVSQNFNGIISVDSRQIYKNIPIFSGISENEKNNNLLGFLDE